MLSPESRSVLVAIVETLLSSASIPPDTFLLLTSGVGLAVSVVLAVVSAVVLAAVSAVVSAGVEGIGGLVTGVVVSSPVVLGVVMGVVGVSFSASDTGSVGHTSPVSAVTSSGTVSPFFSKQTADGQS